VPPQKKVCHEPNGSLALFSITGTKMSYLRSVARMNAPADVNLLRRRRIIPKKRLCVIATLLMPRLLFESDRIVTATTLLSTLAAL
jgi:hypothetical protein